MTSIIDLYKKDFDKNTYQYMSIDEYFDRCKHDKMAYATAAERIIAAVGEPELVDTSKDDHLSRIFSNRTLRVYPAFKEFYGMEDAIERIVGYFRHAAQGLEERKQILYLLGPVGGGKSSLAERLKELMEVHPIYCLASKTGEISPVFESPLGLFSSEKYGQYLSDNYNIGLRYLNTIMSPWALKRLKEYNGDISMFKVVCLQPSKLEQIAVMKTEPGDENNQDISTLVGKVDIRKLENFSQNDTDAYSYSGGLCRANQGLLEFVEMFKAPIKVLHPLLTATQEGNYIGTEAISAIPFHGIVLAHSNEAEWQTFRNNKNNEAFLDRISVVKVPYCLRVNEEKKIITAKPLHPYTPVSPYLYRVFIEGASPAALAVSLPGNLSYCWDASVCKLSFSWSGGFLDNSELWKGKGDVLAKVVGTLFFRDKTEFPLSIGNNDGIQVVDYKGYSLINRYPEFHYTLNGLDVYELIMPNNNAKGLIRKFRIPGCNKIVWFNTNPTDGVSYLSSAGKWKNGKWKLLPKQAKDFSITMSRKEGGLL